MGWYVVKSREQGLKLDLLRVTWLQWGLFFGLVFLGQVRTFVILMLHGRSRSAELPDKEELRLDSVHGQCTWQQHGKSHEKEIRTVTSQVTDMLRKFQLHSLFPERAICGATSHLFGGSL